MTFNTKLFRWNKDRRLFTAYISELGIGDHIPPMEFNLESERTGVQKKFSFIRCDKDEDEIAGWRFLHKWFTDPDYYEVLIIND